MNIDQLSDEQVERLFAITQGRPIDQLSDDEVTQVYSLAQPQEEERGFLGTAKDVGLGALEGLGRGLDYAGGLMRTGEAYISDAALPVRNKILEAVGSDFREKPMYKEGDWARAFVGEAPTGGEQLERMGLGELGSLSDLAPGMFSEDGNEYFKFQKGGALDFTGRGALGFSRDIAVDPLSYAAAPLTAFTKGTNLGSKVAQGAEKVLTAPSRATKGVGRRIYHAGLNQLDEILKKEGKDPSAFKDLLFENNITGNYASIADQTSNLADDLYRQQQALLKQADVAGVALHPDDINKVALDYIAHQRSLPHANMAELDDLERFVKMNIEADPTALAQAQKKYAQDMRLFGAEKERYLDQAKNYRKNLREYRKAGGDAQQDVLPGLDDVGQKHLLDQEMVQVHGADPSVMEAQRLRFDADSYDPQNLLFDEPFQHELLNIPHKQVNVKARKANPPSIKKVNNTKLAEKIDRQLPIWDESQMRIDGLDLVPHRYEPGYTQQLFEAPAGYQTSMVVSPPTRPVRPELPLMDPVPTKRIKASLAAETKSNLRKQKLPASAYTSTGVTSNAHQVRKKLADGYQHTLVDEANLLRPGLGDEVATTNDNLGMILSSDDQMAKEVGKEGRKKAFTVVDGMLAGAAAKSSDNLWLLGLKKAAEIANKVGPRTTVGRRVFDIGDMPLYDDVLRRAYIEGSTD